MEVEIYWVPEHVSVKGNEQTDRTAKKAVGSTVISRGEEQFSSLAHINQMIMEKKWMEVKHWFKTNHEWKPYTQRARYNPSLGT